MALLATGPAATLDGLDAETADRLFIVVNGRELTFFVDGQLAARIFTDDIRFNRIGFVVQTVDEAHVHTHFDRLSIWDLPPTVPPAGDGVVTTSEQPDFAAACAGGYASENTVEEWRSHTIQAGETLSFLANLYDVTAQAIMDINNISDPNLIREGETFLIPPAGW